MPRVVPSQVCVFIDSLPSYTVAGDIVSMNKLGSAFITAILDLVEQIPDELLTMDKGTYSSFTSAKANLRDVIQTWLANNSGGQTRMNIQFAIPNDPVRVIRTALAECPDESPAPSTSELKFIKDAALRESLRTDMGAITRALSNGEWKATTVLGGSVIEALLLWALQKRRKKKATDITNAAKTLHANGTIGDKPTKKPLEEWDLHAYIEVAPT